MASTTHDQVDTLLLLLQNNDIRVQTAPSPSSLPRSPLHDLVAGVSLVGWVREAIFIERLTHHQNTAALRHRHTHTHTVPPLLCSVCVCVRVCVRVCVCVPGRKGL